MGLEPGTIVDFPSSEPVPLQECTDGQCQWEGPSVNSENGVRRTKLRMASKKKKKKI